MALYSAPPTLAPRTRQAVALAGGTVTIDPTLGDVDATITATTTIALTNEQKGQTLGIRLSHDGTGTAFTLTWPANVKFAAGTFGTNKAGTNSAGSIDTVLLERDASNWDELGRALNLS